MDFGAVRLDDFADVCSIHIEEQRAKHRALPDAVYTPCLKKTVQFCFCQNFVKFPRFSAFFTHSRLIRYSFSVVNPVAVHFD